MSGAIYAAHVAGRITDDQRVELIELLSVMLAPEVYAYHKEPDGYDDTIVLWNDDGTRTQEQVVEKMQEAEQRLHLTNAERTT